MYSRLKRLMLALTVGLFRLTAHAQETQSRKSGLNRLAADGSLMGWGEVRPLSRRAAGIDTT
jgi:hypothetical protein